IGRAERIFPRRRQLFGRVDNLDRALLKLDRVPARVLRGCDQLFRQLDVSIMIDPDLADEIARMTVADELEADLDLAHDRMYPVFRAAVSNRNRVLPLAIAAASVQCNRHHEKSLGPSGSEPVHIRPRATGL